MQKIKTEMPVGERERERALSYNKKPFPDTLYEKLIKFFEQITFPSNVLILQFINVWKVLSIFLCMVRIIKQATLKKEIFQSNLRKLMMIRN